MLIIGKWQEIKVCVYKFFVVGCTLHEIVIHTVLFACIIIITCTMKNFCAVTTVIVYFTIIIILVAFV